MTTAWVAAAVRSRAMSRRRLGAGEARAIAARRTAAEAVEALSLSPYGQYVRVGQSVAEAQHGIAAALLWHLRVLAGWAPHGDAVILRVLAGGFEIANTDEHLRVILGAPSEPPFRLGSLASVWTQIDAVTSTAELRDVLAGSVWGDPGADTPAAIHLGMRLSWTARVCAAVPVARPWAAGAAALLLAREVVLAGQRLTPESQRVAARVLGWPGATSRSLTALTDAVPPEARWALTPAQDTGELWRAEAAWWTRVEHDGFTLLRRPLTTSDPVIGAAAVLAADAWRLRAALECAARGGAEALEAFDAVA